MEYAVVKIHEEERVIVRYPEEGFEQLPGPIVLGPVELPYPIRYLFGEAFHQTLRCSSIDWKEHMRSLAASLIAQGRKQALQNMKELHPQADALEKVLLNVAKGRSPCRNAQNIRGITNALNALRAIGFDSVAVEKREQKAIQLATCH